MSRTPLVVLNLALALLGAAGLAYVMLVVPPYGGEGELNVWALLLFFGSLFALTAGLGALLALALHRRWPALAGQRQKLRSGETPSLEAAMRQGILLGLVVAALTALSMLGVLDVAFALVTVLLAGLVEAFAQTRR